MALSSLATHILNYLNIYKITPTQYLDHISGAYNIGKTYRQITAFYTAFSYDAQGEFPSSGTITGLFRKGMQELVAAGH